MSAEQVKIMPIPNFDFPGVTLTQNFEETIANTVSDMSVACVGQQYKTHRADVASEAAMLDQSKKTYSSISGLSGVALPGLISADNVDTATATQRVVIKNGSFSYCTAGASNNKPTLKDDNIISFESPIRASEGYPAHIMFASMNASVGDVVRIKDTAEGGEEIFTNINEISFVAGEGYTQMRVDSVGGIAPGAAIEVSFCLQYNTVLTHASGAFTIANGIINLNPGIEVSIPALAGKMATFEKGDIYVEYRERAYDLVGTLGSVGTVADILDSVGSIHADNPLAVALYFALSAADGNIVYFTCVRSNDSIGYAEALDYLEKYTNIYSIALDTSDKDIILACGASVVSASEDIDSKVRRTLWYSIDAKETIVLAEAPATVTAVDGDDSLKAVRFVDNVFLSNTTIAGDIIYDAAVDKKYKIVKTNGLNTAYVDATIASSSVAKVLQVVRTNPRNDDVIEDLILQRVVSSYKAQCVFGDGVLLNGEPLGSYAAAAAAAGMRSGEYCHRPLSNLGYTFFTLSEPHGFTRSQLKRLGSYGVWIIGNNNNNIPSNLRQVTSAASGNVNKDEESIVANSDNIALTVANLGENMVGNSNITDDLLTSLSIQLSTTLDGKCKNISGNSYIGPQLIEYEIESLYQDAVNLDHVYATFTITPPKPFNKFSMTMRII